jgi:hypothetical protein
MTRVRLTVEIEEVAGRGVIVTASIHRDGTLAHEWEIIAADFDAGERAAARILDAFRAAVCP